MDASLQKILGVEKLDDPALPGTRSWDAGRVVYVFRPPDADPSDAFDALIAEVRPPIPKHGAVLQEHWAVQTPDGETFYSLYFHGDVEGWRQQIELGAKRLRLKTAKVKDDKLVVSGGRTVPLSDCAITFDGSPFPPPGQRPSPDGH